MEWFPVLIIVFIAIAFIMDIRTSRIPNWLNGVGIILGFIGHLLLEGWEGLSFSFIGSITGFILVLILYGLGAVGAGDVKLFAAMGALLGVNLVFWTLSYSLLYAGVIGILILLYHQLGMNVIYKIICWFFASFSSKPLQALKEIKLQTNLRFPFMYAVAPGYLTVWYFN